MINDCDTNIVYLSERLAKGKYSHPEFFKQLTDLFDSVGIRWDVLKHTKDYWVRDFMPVQISKDDFLKYKYAPDYLVKKKGLEGFITDCAEECEELGIKCRETDIVIDGGNVVLCGDCVVMTDKVFEENGVEKGDARLTHALEQAMRHKVVFIPWVRHATQGNIEDDVFGHADGFVKYCGGNKLLMTNHREAYPDEADAIRQVLEDSGFEVTEMLFSAPRLNPDLNWAYINFLQVGREIIMPCFGIGEDEQAERYVREAFPECSVHTIGMEEIAVEGGALHCLTWNIMR